MSVVEPNQFNLYPHDLLDSALQPCATRRWWILYTKPRHEKALARRLYERGIPFYLPLIDRYSVSRGRRITSRVPLFPAYLFLFGDESDRRASLETNRVAHVLSVPCSADLQRDLRQIRRLIESRAPLSVESRLERGQRVRVKHGSFDGMEGTVLMRRGETRLVISVEFLQQGASVAIDDFMVEPV